MQSSSSGGGRDSRSSHSRPRGGRRRSQGDRSGGRDGASRRESARQSDGPDEFRPSEHAARGRRRESPKPAPKPTTLQKFVKLITLGLVDPTAKQTRKPQAKKAESTSPVPGKPTRESRPARTEREAEGAKRERRAPAYVEPSTPRLYVGNLSFDVGDSDLEVLFGAHGSVVLAEVVRQGGSSKSKGYAFVEMSSVAEAKAAALALNDHELQGRKMLVTGAKTEGRSDGGPRTERPERAERSPRSGGRGERRERGGRSRGGRGDDYDEIDKPSRKVRPLVIETVSSPSLLLASLNADAAEIDVTDLFAGIGSIVLREDAGLAADGLTRSLRVDLAATSEAQKAVELLDGKFFMGHQLRVTGADGGRESVAALAEAPANPEA